MQGNAPIIPVSSSNYHPGFIITTQIVLVAHNGYAFDFPLLLSEIERRPTTLTFSALETIQFSDTLPFLQQVGLKTDDSQKVMYIFVSCS